jgi:hypothetical protein
MLDSTPGTWVGHPTMPFETKVVRVLVTGSRDWRKRRIVYGALSRIVTSMGQGRLVVVHGKCPTGADAIADEWAKVVWAAEPEPHRAEWEKYGKPAGFIRNQEMVDLGADVCLAFIRNGSKGATHCADRAEKAGIPVERYYDDEPLV